MEYQASVTSKGQITIPKVVREKLRIEQGDVISFIIENNQAVMSKVETQLLCKCRKQDCVVCLNTKKVDFSIPFFSHVTKVKETYGYQLQVNFISSDEWSVTCKERKLTSHEETALTEWVRQSLRRNEWLNV